jgi:hypothetical protein
MTRKLIHIDFFNRKIFTYFCKIGDLERMQHILYYYDKQYSITKQYDIQNNAFIIACEYGYLHIAQWLLKIYPAMDISNKSGYNYD